MEDFLQRKIILTISYRLGYNAVYTWQAGTLHNHLSDILKSNTAFPS
jgi:hypothetical protein